MIDFIKDADCTKETPVKLGVPDAPIYGKGIKLKPRVDGRTDSEHFKKIYLPELFPDDYAALRHDEEVLGFTLDNKKNLDEFIGDTQSCVCWKDKAAIHSILTGEFNTDDIYTNDWNYPVGAFHGADGGSC